MKYRKKVTMSDWSEEVEIEGTVSELFEYLHYEWKKDVVSEATDNKAFLDPGAKADEVTKVLSEYVRVTADKRR